MIIERKCRICERLQSACQHDWKDGAIPHEFTPYPSDAGEERQANAGEIRDLTPEEKKNLAQYRAKKYAKVGQAQKDDPICAECGHIRSLHSIEPPYDLTGEGDTYCEGFAYVAKSPKP